MLKPPLHITDAVSVFLHSTIPIATTSRLATPPLTHTLRHSRTFHHSHFRQVTHRALHQPLYRSNSSHTEHRRDKFIPTEPPEYSSGKYPKTDPFSPEFDPVAFFKKALSESPAWLYALFGLAVFGATKLVIGTTVVKDPSMKRRWFGREQSQWAEEFDQPEGKSGSEVKKSGKGDGRSGDMVVMGKEGGGKAAGEDGARKGGKRLEM